MPSILRIFLYQTDASLLYLGLCDPYGQGGSPFGAEPGLQHYAVSDLIGECAYAPMHYEADCDYGSGQCQSLCEWMFHICVFNRRGR